MRAARTARAVVRMPLTLSDFFADRIEYVIKMDHDIRIPESQNCISQRFQMSCPRQIIALLIFMLRAVEFDDYLRMRRTEVGNVASNHHLTPEPDAFEAAISQGTP